MNRNNIPARRTLKLRFLTPQKRLYTPLLNLPKVTHKIKPITRQITPSHTVNLLTRQILAFIAEPHLALHELLAGTLNEAVFAPGNAARAVSDAAALLRYASTIGQVSFADRAIHAAGCNEFSRKLDILHTTLSVAKRL